MPSICDPETLICVDSGADPATQVLGPAADTVDPCANLAGDPTSYANCQKAWAAKQAGAAGPYGSAGVSPIDQFLISLPQAPTTSAEFWSRLGNALPGGAAGTGTVLLAVLVLLVFVVARGRA